ncbi:helix-turn-helix domain-containing protein [Streptomyces sp. NPDC047117]|uniref:winged helix-turn-helix transcriptional regulator n=1 Tax=Streptomyces sp. NPDC047117 TaxID=3155379 RepID=UPI0034032285
MRGEPMEEQRAYASEPGGLPPWALRRAASVLSIEGARAGNGLPAGTARLTAAELARRTGLSRSLARRCLHRLRSDAQAR